MREETRKLLKNWLKENSEERLNICKSINSYDGSMDFSDFTYIEDLAEYTDAYELARSIVYGNVTNIEEPVRYNGYANLENIDEYEIEEEGERVPAQMRILAAQAAQANPSNRGGSADGRSRSSRVLRR